MAEYRKKPVVIEARQYEHHTQSNDLALWCGGRIVPAGIVIPTLEGDHLANVGDFIIRGVKGEFYPCKPDIFAATYEAV